MTRDQAIEIYCEIYKDSSMTAAKAIDVMVALGILKLDEPKTATDRALEVINRNIIANGGRTFDSAGLCEIMKIADCRIVDK